VRSMRESKCCHSAASHTGRAKARCATSIWGVRRHSMHRLWATLIDRGSPMCWSSLAAASAAATEAVDKCVVMVVVALAEPITSQMDVRRGATSPADVPRTPLEAGPYTYHVPQAVCRLRDPWPSMGQVPTRVLAVDLAETSRPLTFWTSSATCL